MQGYIEGKEEGLEQGLVRGYRQGYVQGLHDAARQNVSGNQQGATNQNGMRGSGNQRNTLDAENQTPPSPVGTDDTEGPADMLNSNSEDQNDTETEDTDTEQD